MIKRAERSTCYHGWLVMGRSTWDFHASPSHTFSFFVKNASKHAERNHSIQRVFRVLLYIEGGKRLLILFNWESQPRTVTDIKEVSKSFFIGSSNKQQTKQDRKVPFRKCKLVLGLARSEAGASGFKASDSGGETMHFALVWGRKGAADSKTFFYFHVIDSSFR
ncbi:hypothetical protein CDAR_82741 [Caerostris darwini]|uniref:Uncharacterized protein n=1 Tax=Caerostris darwini TaxID=1538125 RepID=A0AAV4U8F5_9ARAC|nr:hypothetical protein CDAR_82741 [Caerostris darwini]